MNKFTPETLKYHLSESISQLLKHKDLYLNSPEKAFSRVQKLSFHDTMLFPIVASSESTSVEMLDYFPETRLPSQSAMNYRRDQVNIRAFCDLFTNFTAKIPHNKKFRGMRLIACDGTRLNTPYNPNDPDSFIQCIEGRKGFNQYHLNTCYDVLNDVFVDAVIQGYFSMNERRAFCEMIDRFSKDEMVVFVADRGFSSYNVIAHIIRNGHSFVIRITSSMAEKILCDDTSFLNQDSFDKEEDIHIGRVRTKQSRTLSNYHAIGHSKTYDYIPVGSKEIDRFHVRLIKFELPGGNCEYLLTNLCQSMFSLSEIKEIYRLRWGIETSYRHLKYAAGMIHVHSLKQNFIFQEVYAKLICYNFCAAVMKTMTGSESGRRKYKYVPDKTYIIKCCMRFLRNRIDDIQSLLLKRKVPVRDGRKFDRIIRRQHADTLQYR